MKCNNNSCHYLIITIHYHLITQSLFIFFIIFFHVNFIFRDEIVIETPYRSDAEELDHFGDSDDEDDTLHNRSPQKAQGKYTDEEEERTHLTSEEP